VIKIINNYRGISLLSTSHKMVLNIIQSRLSVYIDEIIWDHQCWFQHNRSTTDQIFCSCQIMGEKMGVRLDSTSTRLQDSVRSELYNILTEFGVPMCLNKTYSEFCISTRATRRNIPEDTILHSHRHENLKSYKVNICLIFLISKEV
jgi:hypothetical protein